MGGVVIRQVFEVFDAYGAFFILLGRPWLDAVRAIQNFHEDTLILGSSKNEVLLKNAWPGWRTQQWQQTRRCGKAENETNHTTDVATTSDGCINTLQDNHERVIQNLENERHHQSYEIHGIRMIAEDTYPPLPRLLLSLNPRLTEPFEPGRVMQILKEVTIG